MNSIVLSGRTTADPEFFAPKNEGGKAYARVNIAVNRQGKPKEGQPSADFFTLKIFGKTAEYAKNYVGKGQLIEVTGTLQNEEYEKDGVKRKNTVVMVSQLNTLEKKKDAEAPAETADSAPFPADDEDLDVPFN